MPRGQEAGAGEGDVVAVLVVGPPPPVFLVLGSQDDEGTLVRPPVIGDVARDGLFAPGERARRRTRRRSPRSRAGRPAAGSGPDRTTGAGTRRNPAGIRSCRPDAGCTAAMRCCCSSRSGQRRTCRCRGWSGGRGHPRRGSRRSSRPCPNSTRNRITPRSRAMTRPVESSTTSGWPAWMMVYS